MSVTPQSVGAEEITPAWQNYIDVADAMAWLQIDPGQQAAYQLKMQDLVDMACWWVQDYLGRPIAPTTYDRRFDSDGTSTRFSLPYYPILSIEKVVETWGLNGDHVLVYQTPESQGAANQETYQAVWLEGTLIRTFQGLIERPWFVGVRNIHVVWTAGYNPLPPTLKIATRELIAYWWRNTQEAPKWFRGQQNEYDASQSQLWPAVPNKVTSLLETFVQQGVG